MTTPSQNISHWLKNQTRVAPAPVEKGITCVVCQDSRGPLEPLPLDVTALTTKLQMEGDVHHAVRLSQCGHVVGECCIVEWVRGSRHRGFATCPHCRTVLVEFKEAEDEDEAERSARELEEQMSAVREDLLAEFGDDPVEYDEYGDEVQEEGYCDDDWLPGYDPEDQEDIVDGPALSGFTAFNFLGETRDQ